MSNNDIKIRLLVQTAGGKKEIKEFNTSLSGMGDQADKSGRKAGNSFRSLFGSAKKFLGVAGVAGLVYTATRVIRSGYRRMMERGKEFESSLAELSAITGIAGSDLDALGKEALDASVEFGVAANNIIEANKLVASQLAEKIDFGTAEGMRELQQISREAVVLARAAGVDLSTAVQTTTTAINQFNLEASETNRIINSIAAGSKFGAAEAQAQSDTYREAGSVFSAANRSFEELNASTQVLAANAISGRRAGTGLRNMMTILQTEAAKLAKHGVHDLNVETDTWNETLAKLQPLLGDTAALAEIFGRENLSVAQIMIQNAGSVESMTEKITGTQTAYEQAEVRMNTYEGAAERLSAVIDSQLIPAFQEHNGVMVQGINTLIEWVKATGNAVRVMNDWFDISAALTEDLRTELDLMVESVNDGTGVNEMMKRSLEGSVSAMQSQLKVLRELHQEEDIRTAQYWDTKAQMAELEQRIHAYNQLIETYKEETAAATEETGEFTEAAVEEEVAVANLAEQVKNLKDEYEDLISQPSISDADLFRAAQIQQEIADVEELIEKRKELTAVKQMQDIDVAGEAEAAAEEQAARESERHQQRIARINEEKQAALKAERDKKAAQLETQKQYEDATRRIVANAAIRSESGRDVANTMIDALFAEITAIAIKKAMKSAPFPANLLLAAGAAGAASGLRNLIPRFADGGQIRGPGTGRSDSVPVMASRGEYMLNAQSTQALGARRMDKLNGSPSMAKAVGKMMDRLPHLANGNRMDLSGLESAVRSNRGGGTSNRELVEAINSQTDRLASVERKISFKMSEFKDAEDLWNIQQEGLGRG